MNIAQKMAETVIERGTKLGYGEAIEADGATIIPVAVVTYGFGGGGDESDNGGGGGGGVSVPLGIYEARNGETRFHANPVTLMLVSIPLVVATGVALSRVLRMLR